MTIHLINDLKLCRKLQFIGFLFFRILEVLRMSSLSTEFKTHMVNIVSDTMEYRERNNISRNDFIQLLMELRKTGKVKGHENQMDGENTEDSSNDRTEHMTIEQCAAQVAIFYLAGFDTTASAIANCLYELCRHPESMRRIHQEIDEVLKQNDNVISYESINKMDFLDRCVLGNSCFGIILNWICFFYFVIYSFLFRNFKEISNLTIP